MKKHLSLMLLTLLVTTVGIAVVHAQSGDDAVRKASQAAKSNAKAYKGASVPARLKKNASENKAARKAYDATQTPEYKARVAAESKRLSEGVLGVSGFTAQYSDLPGGSGEGTAHDAPKLAADERVYIFISSSMPESTLRAYAAAIDRLGDRNVVMVMRGFVGGVGSFLQTGTFISKILFKDVNCRKEGCSTYGAEVIIDPELYRRYRPQSVPAIVFAKGVRPFDPDRSEGNKDNTPAAAKWWLVYGDASLGHVLTVIDREAKTEKLGKMGRVAG